MPCGLCACLRGHPGRKVTYRHVAWSLHCCDKSYVFRSALSIETKINNLKQSFNVRSAPGPSPCHRISIIFACFYHVLQKVFQAMLSGSGAASQMLQDGTPITDPALKTAMKDGKPHRSKFAFWRECLEITTWVTTAACAGAVGKPRRFALGSCCPGVTGLLSVHLQSQRTKRLA